MKLSWRTYSVLMNKVELLFLAGLRREVIRIGFWGLFSYDLPMI